MTEISKKYQLKISGKSSGIIMKKLDLDECSNIIAALAGKDGIQRLSIEWDTSELSGTSINITEEDILPTYSTITDTTGNSITPLPTINMNIQHEDQNVSQIIDPENPPTTDPPSTESDISELLPFKEIDRIPKHKHGQHFNTDRPILSYFNPGDGKLIIQYGNGKVFTTWETMAALPYPINLDQLRLLNTQKLMAVKQFKEWMHRRKMDLPKPQADPAKQETEDPDLPFRKILNQDTSTKYDNNKIEGSLED